MASLIPCSLTGAGHSTMSLTEFRYDASASPYSEADIHQRY